MEQIVGLGYGSAGVSGSALFPAALEQDQIDKIFILKHGKNVLTHVKIPPFSVLYTKMLDAFNHFYEK